MTRNERVPSATFALSSFSACSPTRSRDERQQHSRKSGEERVVDPERHLGELSKFMTENSAPLLFEFCIHAVFLNRLTRDVRKSLKRFNSPFESPGKSTLSLSLSTHSRHGRKISLEPSRRVLKECPATLEGARLLKERAYFFPELHSPVNDGGL